MAAGARFDLEFRIRRAWLAGGSYLVAPAGELDTASGPQLSHALLEVAAGERVVVDLTDVTFVDSTALGSLVAEAKARRHAGGELVVVADDGRTRRVLELTGLDRIFRVHRTLRDALEAER